jgi:hypothetical protein
MNTVLEVADRARRVYLNDAGVEQYSNEVMLPFIQQAYGEAQIELTLNGLGITKERSTTLSVAAGESPVITTVELPDLVTPLELAERAPGETYFYPMAKLDWEPNTERTGELRYWNWRENEIKLLGALSIREVQVKYIKGLPALLNDGSTINMLNALEFLAARSSGLASRFVGGNIGRADACDSDAGRLLPKLVAVEVKSTQSIAHRRLPFGYSRNNR